MSGSNPSAGGSGSSSSASSSSSAAAAAGGAPSAPAAGPPAAPTGDARATAASAAPAAAAEELLEARDELVAAKTKLEAAEADLAEAKAKLKLYEFHEKWKDLLAGGEDAWNTGFPGADVLPHADAAVLLRPYTALRDDAERAAWLRDATQTANTARTDKSTVQAEVTRCAALVTHLETELKPRQPEARGVFAGAGARHRALGVVPMDVDGPSNTSVISRRDVGYVLVTEYMDGPGYEPVRNAIDDIVDKIGDRRTTIARPAPFEGDPDKEPNVVKHILEILEQERIKRSAPASWRPLEVRDVHDKMTFRTASGSRDLVPDIVVLKNSPAPATNLNVMSVIEVKTDATIRKPESAGQVAEYLNALMTAPWRERAMGILISSTMVRFFLWRRTGSRREDLETRVSDLLNLSDQGVFRNVLAVAFGTASDVSNFSRVSEQLHDAGFDEANVTYLGAGASSVCVAAQWRGEPVVVKLPNELDGVRSSPAVPPTVSRDAAREMAALRDLESVTGIPKLVNVDDVVPYVVLTPVGNADTSRVYIRDVVSALAVTLRLVHHRRWVHCDVRASNVCFTPNPHRPVPLLIDFGCAREIDSVKQPYSGTLTTASLVVLSQIGHQELYRPDPKDDMESLVKLTFLQCLRKGDRRAVNLYVKSVGARFPDFAGPAISDAENPSTADRWANAGRFWDVVEKSYETLKNALSAARLYDPLSNQSFKELCKNLENLASTEHWDGWR
eukprot:TRINITY_DN718_c0_g1_i20.p1 TRINITY_DN718_c0_g1~~TRINITY_DN718_c0_g1_i20.p1  ORF type:complete len:764 (-),score=118.18 TRINITY_DN718_c0_g1_i20:63-2258(-)